jgi:hypothetical protein
MMSYYTAGVGVVIMGVSVVSGVGLGDGMTGLRSSISAGLLSM